MRVTKNVTGSWQQNIKVHKDGVTTTVDAFMHLFFWHLSGSVQQPPISSYDMAGCQECISLATACFLLR